MNNIDRFLNALDNTSADVGKDYTTEQIYREVNEAISTLVKEGKLQMVIEDNQIKYISNTFQFQLTKSNLIPIN